MKDGVHMDANIYSVKRRRKKRWYSVFFCLAAVVVFSTTYALILPAITMENTVCDISEHTHTVECYRQITYYTDVRPVCSEEYLGIHQHTPRCYDREGEVICGYADFVVHQHDASCYDEEGGLWCPLPEIYTHKHTELCYFYPESETVIEIPGTEFDLDSYFQSEDTETYGYDDVNPEDDLNVESQEERNADCFEKPWETEKKYQPILVCGTKEIILHEHTKECFDRMGNLICGKMQVLQHIHNEDCFEEYQIPIDSETLTCCMAEDERHTHTAVCYGTWELICTLPEHIHTEECQPDLHLEETKPEELETEEPESEEPETEEAETDETVTEEPETDETETDETVTEEPEKNETETEEPESEEPETEEAETEESETGEPETDEPETDEPETDETVTEETETEEPETKEPEMEESETEETETEEAETEESETEEPETEEPESEEPESEEPETEEAETEEPESEEPETEEAETEEPETGEPETEEPEEDKILSDDGAYISLLSEIGSEILSQQSDSETRTTVVSGDTILYEFRMDIESYSDDSFVGGRVKLEFVLPLTEEHASFDTAAMTWLDMSEEYEPQITNETRIINDNETVCQVLSGFMTVSVPGEVEINAVINTVE